MPIHEFKSVRSRCRIGIVDEVPTPQIRAALPGYDVYRCDPETLDQPGALATTAAVIFRQSANNPKRIAKHLDQMAAKLLWHGCLIFIQPLPVKNLNGEQRLRPFFVDAIGALKLPVHGLGPEESKQVGDLAGSANQPILTPLLCVLRDTDDWLGVLVSLQLHPPGSAPHFGSKVELKGSDGIERSLNLEETLLVQRAFGDSAQVRLEQLPGGLSDVKAYRAYVSRQVDQVGGEWPYRYFVKIGEREKVAKEYRNYCDIALEHLPYHLGPRLRRERCELGHSLGIIVSDYVAGAESLRNCARDGRAVAAIANLFNVTFRAWHNGARNEDTPLQDHLRQRILDVRIRDFRQPLITEYGAQKSLDELSELLLSGNSRPVSMGVIHGDLHANNVLVRGGEAILIDFEKVQSQAPVLRDMACLEGGLLVSGFVGDTRSPMDILASIDRLYESAQLLGERISPCHPIEESAWFFDCILQIRMHALQFEREPGQYALLLASEFIRKACNSRNFDDEHDRGEEKPGMREEQTRAIAWVLAERILTRLPVALTHN